MSFAITRPGKTQLVIDNPVMNAAGIMGYGNTYHDMINLTKLGALVTNPVTYAPRQAATPPRIIPMDSGVLVHTGLPNMGISKVVKRWRDVWAALPIPVIVHLMATNTHDIQGCLAALEHVEHVAAVELGLPDDISARDAAAFTADVVKVSEKPVLVRLPLYDADGIAAAVADAGAGALVVAGAPRGTARDPISGQLVSGRVYGPVVKPLALRITQKIAQRLKDIPVIASGGIHSAQDARDYLEAGAVAVQVDTVVWVLPRMIEIIARDLGGLVLTRQSGALGDEWFTGISQTDVFKRDQNID